MKIVLPFQKPIISHSPFCNCVLGVLQNYPQSFDWIYSNFINVYMDKNNGSDYFFPSYFWKTCPFLDEYILPYMYVRDNFKLYTDFLEYSLSNNFYIYNVLNVKYISKYTEKDGVHNSFIYGIDKEKSIVKICDFFDSVKYEITQCSYDEINESFRNLFDVSWYGTDDFLNEYIKIHLLKFNGTVTCEFSSEVFKQNISKYSEHINLLYNSNWNITGLHDEHIHDFYWGIECWDNILCEGNTQRHFSLLQVYTHMWQYRYNYFVQNKYIEANLEIEKKLLEMDKYASLALLMYMKNVYAYTVKKTEVTFEHINKWIEEWKKNG